MIDGLLDWFGETFEAGAFVRVAEVDTMLDRLASIGAEHQSAERASLQRVRAELEKFAQDTCRDVMDVMAEIFEFSTIRGNDMADPKVATAKAHKTSGSNR